MKGNLKKITDKTLQDLLQNEIILPSTYFQSFDENAKNVSVDIKDPQFENELSHVIVDELKNINNYMQKTVESIDLLTEATEDAQKAIEEKDENRLKEINADLMSMKSEIDELKALLYLDPLTKTFTRRWIYNQAINKDGSFKNNGLLLFINLTDCNYLAEKYGNLLADNVTLYIAKFLTAKFNNERISVDIARYSDSQFVLFITDETTVKVAHFLNNIRMELSNTTLKSKSGLMFKTSFDYGLLQHNKNELFQDVIEKAAALSNQEKQCVKKQ